MIIPYHRKVLCSDNWWRLDDFAKALLCLLQGNLVVVADTRHDELGTPKSALKLR